MQAERVFEQDSTRAKNTVDSIRQKGCSKNGTILGLINNNQIEVVPTVLRLGLTIEPIGLNLLIWAFDRSTFNLFIKE